MAKFQNQFFQGVVDTDSDERFIPPNTLINAENFYVSNSEGNNSGVGKPVAGTVKKSDYNFTGAKTIGTGRNTSKNKVYNFIKANLYDFIIEFDTISELSTIILQSSTGTRLNFKNGERIRNVDVLIDPEGNGDLIKWSGDSNPPRVGNIERMKTWGLDGFTAEEIMLIKAPPTYPVEIAPFNTAEAIENFLEDKLISFAYRWKYKDGYYSAVSTWQEYAFTPSRFNLDYSSGENKGMLNIFNACNLTFETGEREVIAVDLLFKESNGSTIYKIDQFIKEDELWLDNTRQTIPFVNSKQYQILPEDQYFRSFDNVPHYNVAQTVMGQRSTLANYAEGYDLIDVDGKKVVPDYDLELVASNFTTVDAEVTDQTADSILEIGVTIPKGKLSIDFTGVNLSAGSVIYIVMNIKSTSTSSIFQSTYNFILTQGYNSIEDLVNDTSNSFKANLEDYFSEYFTTTALQIPTDGTIDNTPQFIATVISANVITIDLPQVDYLIDNGVDPATHQYEYFQDVITTVSIDSIGSKKSMKSYRSYEIAIIYRDEQVRKTTALTSGTNTLFIPVENSITQNQIQVNIPASMKPPAWAKTYKFAIKQNKDPYEEIYASIFYKDGIFRWVKLDGVNKNKVKEGDILLIKRDINNSINNPVTTKVLEIKEQPINFLLANTDDVGQLIVEQAGLYMKIRPENFSIDYTPNEFINLYSSLSAIENRPIVYVGGVSFSALSDDLTSYVDVPITQGSTVYLYFHSDRHRDSQQNTYQGFFVAGNTYDNFMDYFNAELSGTLFLGDGGQTYSPSVVKGNLTPNYGDGTFIFTPNASPTGLIYLKLEGTASGNGQSRRGFLDVVVSVRNVSGFFIFETLGVDTENQTYFETPEVYTVTNGQHQMQNHLLEKTFNCFVQGNGGEDYQIRNAFNAKYLSIDFSPTAVSEDEYRRRIRYADITYSGIYNSNTNVNKLNEFNLSEANYKDDIVKSYGAIYKIVARDTNLEVYQEDKDSIVYYGKDLLFNADGTTNLTGVPQVLGVQKTYDGEYGISTDSLSLDNFGFNVYHADVKRGVWIKKSNNGLFEISSQKMRRYWKNLFRNNTINEILGCYDQYNDIFICNVKYNDDQFVTWAYSDIQNGWLGKISINPEAIIRLNNDLYMFQNGEIFKCNQVKNGSADNYNVFFDVEYPSKFSFVFSQNPSERKNYKTLDIEGTIPVDMTLTSDLDKGYINKNDFDKKEDVFYAYVRVSDDAIDTSLLSCQGIGECTINGLNLEFAFELDSIISIGDKIINESAQLVGTVLTKGVNFITLNTVNNLSSGDYIACAKPQSIENDCMLGYYLKVDCEFSSKAPQEIYAISTEVAKSFP